MPRPPQQSVSNVEVEDAFVDAVVDHVVRPVEASGKEHVAAVATLEDRVREVRRERELQPIAVHDPVLDRAHLGRAADAIADLPMDDRNAALGEALDEADIDVVGERVQKNEVDELAWVVGDLYAVRSKRTRQRSQECIRSSVRTPDFAEVEEEPQPPHL